MSPCRRFANCVGSLGHRYDKGLLSIDEFVSAILKYLPSASPALQMGKHSDILQVRGGWECIPVPEEVASRTFAVGLELADIYHLNRALGAQHNLWVPPWGVQPK